MSIAFSYKPFTYYVLEWVGLRVVFPFVELALFYLFLATASAAHPEQCDWNGYCLQLCCIILTGLVNTVRNDKCCMMFLLRVSDRNHMFISMRLPDEADELCWHRFQSPLLPLQAPVCEFIPTAANTLKLLRATQSDEPWQGSFKFIPVFLFLFLFV